jgi:hypothetical protein
MPLEFPRSRIAALSELGARLFDSRKVGTPSEPIARELIAGFFDVCMRSGLDRLLVELEQAFTPLDITDRTGLADNPTLFAAVVAQLDAAELDGGSPLSAKARQIADCLIAALGLTIVDETKSTVTLDGEVRAAVIAALASVVDIEMPKLRASIIAHARGQCAEHHLGAFDKICAQLDDRGMTMLKTPKVSLDALQKIRSLLFDARYAVIERLARSAIDRAKDVLVRSDADAAARIDLPITHRLTPRDVAIIRANEARVHKTPAAVVASLLDTLSELVGIDWRAPKQLVRTYAASQTFAVGEVLEHPKFGRGSVVAAAGQRIDVEFADGKHTLVHGKAP